MSRLVYVVTGPTASGKTAVAIDLCRAWDGEVVNADAMQVYRGMDIGTAKPDKEERRGVPHHLIDIRDPSEKYSVADFVVDAAASIHEIQSRGHAAVVCGGTGLYVQSLMEGLEFHPDARDEQVRKELEGQADAIGVAALRRRLMEIDPETAGRLSDHDRRRVIRALEVFETTGQTASRLREDSRRNGSPFQFKAFCLNLDRPRLYERIETRIDRMMAAGLPAEAAGLLSAHPGSTASQAIGYKEFLPYLDGKATLADVSNRIKQATRNYAKRQLTWFRRMPGLDWLDNADPEKTIHQIIQTVSP